MYFYRLYRRSAAAVLAMLLVAALFAGCGESAAAEQGGKLRIAATIFPEYDWVRQILGERAEDAELTLIMDSGVDMHSFQPTVADLVTISQCDLFLYVGGESDSWVEDALAEAVNRDMAVINLLEVLGDAAKEEETVEGMQTEEEAGDGAEGGTEYDEHVWLSLRNAAVFCRRIAEELGRLDSEGKAVYTANAEAYVGKLNALDARYTAAVGEAELHTLLFGDRFPFRYLTEDYGLDYYAAFSGCSAETEASFETIVFLAGKVDQLGLTHVLTIENSDGKIARTIVENTEAKDAEILQMDSLQSATRQDAEEGLTYLDVMEENLEILRQALKKT